MEPGPSGGGDAVEAENTIYPWEPALWSNSHSASQVSRLRELCCGCLLPAACLRSVLKLACQDVKPAHHLQLLPSEPWPHNKELQRACPDYSQVHSNSTSPSPIPQIPKFTQRPYIKPSGVCSLDFQTFLFQGLGFLWES